MSRLTFEYLGWWSRFDFPKTVEISCILKKLPEDKSCTAFNNYRRLQYWVDLYAISCVAPIRVNAEIFSKLVGLRFSFNLRQKGILHPITHQVYAFKALISGIYLLYGKEQITLHCLPDESPEIIRKVVLRLYVKSITPYVRFRVDRKLRGKKSRKSPVKRKRSI